MILLSFPSWASEPQETITISGSDTVYIMGWIGPAIADYILSRNPKKIKRIHLFSKGGKLRNAIEIAIYVRSNNIETYVGEQGECYSACTVIFQAGGRRVAHKSAKFMYHYAFNKTSKTPNFKWTKIMCEYLMDYGMLEDVIDLMKPNKDLYLTAEEAMRYGIVTTVED